MMWVCKQPLGEGNFSIGGQPSWSASYATPRPCCGQTGVGPLTNKITLKFSEGSHQMEDEFAAWCGGINVLGQADKIGSPPFEEVERLDEIFERATQAVELPDHDRIT